MRKVFKAMVLTLALAVPVWAGHIGQPFAQPSIPEPTKSGNMDQPRAVSDVLLSLLPSLVALI